MEFYWLANAFAKLELIKYCNQVDVTSQSTQNIVDQYKEIIDGFGNQMERSTQKQKDQSVPPVVQSPRGILIGFRIELKLDNLVKKRIITPQKEHTDWVNNLLIVKKTKLKIWLDSIPLNEALKRPYFQFITLDKILPQFLPIIYNLKINNKKKRTIQVIYRMNRFEAHHTEITCKILNCSFYLCYTFQKKVSRIKVIQNLILNILSEDLLLKIIFYLEKLI